MNWFKQQFYLLKLFALGGLLPFFGSLLLVWLGVQVSLVETVGSAGAVLLGGLLCGYGGYGLFLSCRSWALPEGRQLRASEAPDLTLWLAECQRSWQGPRNHGVVLDPQAWSLDLIGTPTMGVLGWTRCRWVLGLYPFLALSPREFEALASWEVVWWSDQQGWLNLQVKRLANHWQQLYTKLAEQPAHGLRRCYGAPALVYARWMVRMLEGFLVRECLWADAAIAGQHGAATYGRALCRLAVLRPLLDRRILPELLHGLQAGAPWPEQLLGHFSAALRRCPEGLAGTLDLALDGLVADAPPLLKLRLLQLEVEPAVPIAPSRPALEPLLGETEVLLEVEAALKARIQGQLDLLAQRRQQGDARFQALGPVAPTDLAAQPHALEYLKLALERMDPERFWDLLVAFVEAHPRHPEGKLLMLRWTLRKGWLPQAQAQVAGILAHNPFLAPACHSIMAAHLRDRGALVAAEAEWNLARRAEDLLQRARRERGSATLGDSLEPHGCPASQLAVMVRYLQTQGDLGEAFLVRKKVALHPEHPVLLLVVRPEGAWWDPGGRKREAVQARIERECPFPGRATGHVLVLRPGLLWRYRSMLTGLGALILAKEPG